MQIKKGLIQFSVHRGLFIVTGTVEADFYQAHQGEINKLTSFAVEKPQYSDREGYGQRGGGLVYESGSKVEVIKKTMHQEFIKQLKGTLQELAKEKWDHVYVFCPATAHKEIEAALPADLKKKLVRVWPGNYHKEHLFKLLEKIK